MRCSIVRIAVVVAAVCLAGYAGWSWWFQQNNSCSTLQDTTPIPVRTRTPINETNAWNTVYGDLEESDLIVLPTRDESGLVASQCFDIREYTSRLVQSLLYLAGTPATMPKSWPLYAALGKRDYSFTAPKKLSKEELLALGKELKTKKIVQVIIERRDNKPFGRAEGWDLLTGQSIGEWEAAVDVPRMSYESLFTISSDLAIEIAMGISGVTEQGDLWNPIGTERESQALDQVVNSLYPPTYPKLIRAFRYSLSEIEQSPHSAQAWSAISLVNTLLADKTQDNEMQTHRECMIRSLIAADIAERIDPDNPTVRFINGLALVFSGRAAQGMKKAAADAVSFPEDALIQYWSAALQGEDSDLPNEDMPLLFFDIFRLMLARRNADTEGKLKIIEEWVNGEAYAPYCFRSMATIHEQKSELNYERYFHTMAAVQGTVLAINECIRRQEVSGNVDDASALLMQLCAAVGIDPVQVDLEGDSPMADALDEEIGAQSGNFWSNLVPFQNISWCPGSIQMLLLEAYSEALTALDGTLPTLHATPHGMGLSGDQWLRMAERPAIDNAVSSFRDIAGHYGAPEEGLLVGKALEKLFPRDLYLLEGMAYFYYSISFDNTRVDHYQRNMYKVDFTYLPAQRRSATFAGRFTQEGGREKRIKALQSLKYLGPFNSTTLSFIQCHLESIGEFSLAADYAQLAKTRDPFNIDAQRQAVVLRAEGESRILDDEDVKMLLNLYPIGYPNRACAIGDVYRSARKVPEAIEQYELHIKNDVPTDSGPYTKLAWLYRTTGEHQKALDALERYMEVDSHSLSTCEVLLEKMWVQLGQGDLEGAQQDLRRAAGIDDWKGSVISALGQMHWLKGEYDAAIDEYERLVNRYQDDYSFAELGWAYFLSGDLDKALKAAQAGVQANYQSGRSAFLMSIIFERQGKDEQEVIRPLLAYQRRMVDDPKPLVVLGVNYAHKRDIETALSYFEKAMRITLGNNRSYVLYNYILALIEAGKYDDAEKHIQVYEALNPVLSNPWYCRAKIAFDTGNDDRALELLDIPIKVGLSEGQCLAAEIYLKKGENEKAFELARLSTGSEFNCFEKHWLILGRSAQAIGNPEAAKAACQWCIAKNGENGRYGKQAAQILATL